MDIFIELLDEVYCEKGLKIKGYDKFINVFD